MPNMHTTVTRTGKNQPTTRSDNTAVKSRTPWLTGSLYSFTVWTEVALVAKAVELLDGNHIRLHRRDGQFLRCDLIKSRMCSKNKGVSLK